MKKTLLLTTLIFLFAFTGTGCSDDNTDMQDATQNINLNHQTESGSLTDSVNPATDYEPTSGIENTTNINSQNGNTAEDNYDFSSYEEAINQITKSVNDAQYGSDAQTNQNTFYTLKKQIDRIENDLDLLEDTFEYDYESGKLSFNHYRTRKLTLEQLEDKLEFAEEALENKFHMDD